jgi:hypothetical protein
VPAPVLPATLALASAATHWGSGAQTRLQAYERLTSKPALRHDLVRIQVIQTCVLILVHQT